MPQPPYLAYFYADRDSAPHMEIVSARELVAAREETRRLLAEHEGAAYAEIWQTDRHVSTLLAAGKRAKA